MDYSVKNESIGGGWGGFGGFGGGNCSWIIILLLLFLFLRNRDGFGGNEHGFHGFGHCSPFCAPKPMNPAQGCVDTCTLDKDIYKSAYDTQKTEIEQGEKTRALIEKQAERAADREFQKELFANAAKDARIAALETALHNQKEVAHFNTRLDRIECDMVKMPKCEIPVCPPRCVSGRPCGDEGRRCDC